MSIRVTTLADQADVSALFQRSYPVLLAGDYPHDVLSAALPFMVRAQPALLGSGTYYVWEADGVVQGAGGWTRDPVRTSLGHIRHVAADPACLRQGIAKGIIVHCLMQAQAAGVTEMECWSTRSAVGFYRASGFEQEDSFDVMMGGEVAFPSVRMRRLI